MTEKEKMISSKPYYSSDKELVKDHQNARDLTFKFNNINPNNFVKRNKIIKNLFNSTKNFLIESPFYCDYGYNISIGKNFFSNFNCVILDCAKVTIGDNVMLGPNVSLFTAGHPIHPGPRNKGIEYAFPITIGDNVWIGGGSIINPNITIGNNVVIGSGSVVTKNIQDNSIAVGNPCKIIRQITENDKNFYFKNLQI